MDFFYEELDREYARLQELRVKTTSEILIYVAQYLFATLNHLLHQHLLMTVHKNLF